jgi:hypothetical protein
MRVEPENIESFPVGIPVRPYALENGVDKNLGVGDMHGGLFPGSNFSVEPYMGRV